MNDEIKEILEDLRNKNMSVDDLTHNDKTKLLDCITNLQKENERLNNIVKETRQILYKRMLDDYDTYTANVVCDFQSDFEEIIRLNGGDEE